MTYSYDHEDGGGQLFATATSGPFSGSCSVYIGENALSTFADQLSACPIDPDHPPRLLGGSCHKDGTLREDCDFIEISIRPIDRAGHLVAQIRLGETGYRNPLMFHGVHVAFPVQYQALSDFAAVLRELEKGSVSMAELLATIS
jgi:hypothetical protein